MKVKIYINDSFRILQGSQRFIFEENSSTNEFLKLIHSMDYRIVHYYFFKDREWNNTLSPLTFVCLLAFESIICNSKVFFGANKRVATGMSLLAAFVGI